MRSRLALWIALLLGTGCESVLGLHQTELAAEAHAGIGGSGTAPQSSVDGAAGKAPAAATAGAHGGTHSTDGAGLGGLSGAGRAGGAARSVGAGGSGTKSEIGGRSNTGGSGNTGGSAGTERGGEGGVGAAGNSGEAGQAGATGGGTGGSAGSGNGGLAGSAGAGSGGGAGFAGAGNGGSGGIAGSGGVAGNGGVVIPVGAIVGVDGSCLGIAQTTGGAISDSRAVHRTCVDDPAESWSRDADLHLRAQLVDAYLTVDDDLTEFGASVSVGAAASPVTANQQWTFDGVQLKNEGGLCVDVANGDYDNAPPLQVYHCNLGDNQAWTVTEFGQIEHDGYCFDIPHGVMDDGTPVEVFPCYTDPADNERFVFEHGRIELRNSVKCIGVAGDPTVENTLLEVESCEASGALALGQSFYITGPIMNQGQCLDIGTAGDDMGGSVALKPCNGAAEQVWSWLF